MSEQQRATELSKSSFPARYPFKILISLYINKWNEFKCSVVALDVRNSMGRVSGPYASSTTRWRSIWCTLSHNCLCFMWNWTFKSKADSFQIMTSWRKSSNYPEGATALTETNNTRLCCFFTVHTSSGAHRMSFPGLSVAPWHHV